MLAVYIIVAVLILIALILLLPFSLEIAFIEDFKLKVKFLGIPVYKYKEKQVGKKKSKEEIEKSGIKPKSLFSRFKEKYGFFGTVKAFFAFFKEILSVIKPLIPHIKIRKIRLCVLVASSDAATTAIEYGAVCTAAYPILSFLETVADIGYKKIDIKSDFENTVPHFSFSGEVRFSLCYFLATAFKAYKVYKNFIERV